MRIHTNTLTYGDISGASRKAGFVTFTELARRGSRSHARAFEVKLSGTSAYRQNGGTEQAATWDEWGMFLAELYRLDPTLSAGGKNGYPTAEEFHWKTGGRFLDLTPRDQHRRHKWTYSVQSVTGSYHVSECDCGAVTRNMAYGRSFAELA